MMSEPAAWRTLMEKLADVVSNYLIAQIDAGADVVQVFDSWAGVLSPFDYAESVLPHVQCVINRVKQHAPATPLIYFGTDMAGMSPLLRTTGADVIGVDWRIQLDEAWMQLGNVAVQGNLDPVALFAPWPEVQRRAADVLHHAGGRAGHIFNLGHGILPETPVDTVRRLVDFVHEHSGNSQDSSMKLGEEK
jgi:uroporphyrinogen decarboxylase